MAGAGTLNVLSSSVDFAKSMSPPVARASLYGWNALLPNQLPTSEELFRAYNKGELTPGDVRRHMKNLGFSEDWTRVLMRASLSVLNPLDYVVLYRRGKITRDQFNKGLQAAGFDYAETENLLAVTEYFPSTQDLISFAVRDVYTPETVEEYKLMEDIPSKFLEEAKKAGLPEEQAKNYWASHWGLPSPSQVFQFLQRRVKKPDGKVFSIEDVRTYLKIADYSPQWRDMLAAISYRPITRTDARRMYSFGVLNREELKNVFKDEGYNDNDAEKLTQFTIVHDDPDTTGMTRGNLIGAYVEGAITFDDLKRLMPEIGIIGDALDYWLDIAQFEKTQSEVKKIITRYTNAYLTGSADIDEIRNRLNQSDLPSNFVEKILSDMLYDKLSQRKVPPVDTLIRWLENNVLTDVEFKGRMRLLNYSDEDIVFYLTEVRRKVDTTRRTYLKVEEYVTWFVSGIITEQYFRDTLKEMGKGQQDIDFIIVNARRKANENT